MPNPWDVGSARLLTYIGFEALATTSAGHAATLGRLDGTVSLTEALAHATTIVGATDLPISADFENGFADQPEDVAANVRAAVATGLSGLSIEDYTGNEADPIYDMALAVARVEAAAEAAHSGEVRLVLTARCENFLHGRRDSRDTIARLQAFQEAGADVLYAPWMSDPSDIADLVGAVDIPVNVLARPDGPNVSELAAIGVKRISVGGAFALAGLGAVNRAAREFLSDGTFKFFADVAEGAAARDSAFGAT